MAAYRYLLAFWMLIRRARMCVPMLVVAILLALSTPSCAPSPELRGGPICDLTQDRAGFPSCLPRSSALFCERDAPKVAGRDKALVGQFFPTKPFLGPAQPQCPPNSIRLAQDQELKIAKEGAEALGKQLGVAMASCDIATESLNNRVDHHGAAWQRPDAKVFDLVLANCMTDLLAVPAMPSYDDPVLLGATQKAFEDGVQAGIDQVYRRIMAIEAVLVVVEIAAIEAAPLIELALMRSVRRSLALVREMPILLPLSIDGAGVVIKLARPVAKGSSKALRANMLRAGRPRALLGEFTHHIAAHGDPRAAKSIEILEGFGIKADHEANGVNLPGYASSPNPKGKVVHGNLHTDAYHKAVEKRLKQARTPADAELKLREMAWELEHGITPK